MMVAPLLLLLALAVEPPSGQASPTAAPQAEEELFEEVVAWVNDDVVLWFELRETERADLQRILEQNPRTPPDELARKAQEIRERVLFDLITNRLLVQEAERIADIELIKDDVLKRFKEQENIKTDEELDRRLAEWGYSRTELEDRLLQSSAPQYVLDVQVHRTLSVSEEEARRYYEEHKTQLGAAAQVTFRELALMVEDQAERASRRAEAEAIVARARTGEDFTALVRELSEAPSRTLDGLIGPIQPRDLAPEIARAAQDVAVGEVSEPIETSRGWVVIRVEQRRDAETPSFESVRRECEEGVRRAKAGPAYDAFVKKLWKSATIEVRRRYGDRLPSEWREAVKVRD